LRVVPRSMIMPSSLPSSSSKSSPSRGIVWPVTQGHLKLALEALEFRFQSLLFLVKLLHMEL
jgi:hypothetical protein